MIEIINSQKHGDIIIDENSIKNVVHNILKNFSEFQCQKINFELNNTDYLFEIFFEKINLTKINQLPKITKELRKGIETNLEIYNFIINFNTNI
jgi:hypothetical protein